MQRKQLLVKQYSLSGYHEVQYNHNLTQALTLRNSPSANKAKTKQCKYIYLCQNTNNHLHNNPVQSKTTSTSNTGTIVNVHLYVSTL